MRAPLSFVVMPVALVEPWSSKRRYSVYKGQGAAVDSLSIAIAGLFSGSFGNLKLQT